MTQDQWIILSFKVTMLAGFAAALLWVAVYSYLARWWKNEIGETVTRLALYLAALYLPSLLSLFLHFSRLTSRAAGWFDVGIFTLVAVELLRRIPLWVRLHLDRDGRQTYPGMLPFIRQVIRRRGRPVWEDDTPPDQEYRQPP